MLEVLKNNTRDSALLEFACGCLAALCIMVDNAIMCVNEKAILPILEGIEKNPKEPNPNPNPNPNPDPKSLTLSSLSSLTLTLSP